MLHACICAFQGVGGSEGGYPLLVISDPPLVINDHHPTVAIVLLGAGAGCAPPIPETHMRKPALRVTVDDRHAADPAWAIEDIKGHGTQMAGLALYGDLTPKLHDQSAVEISYRLESVKLLPDAGENPHYLLGAVTRNAINVVEQNHPRRRTFTMASTTGEDTPHDGAPHGGA